MALLASLLLGPGSPVAFAGQDSPFDRAEALLAARRFREARELARAAEGTAPQREAVLWRWLIAESYQMEGDHEEAAAAFDAISREGPQPARADATLRLAKSLLQMWDAAAASKALARLRGNDIGDLGWERDELEAITSFVAGKPNEALALLEKLPRKSDAGWHYMGLIAFNAGDFKAAVGYFDKAIAAAPGDYYNQLYRASCLLELNRLDEAREAFRAILRIAETPEVNQLLGRLELRAGRIPEAESCFRKAIALSPRNAEAWFGLMTVLRRQSKNEEAKAAAGQFQELHARQQQGLTMAYKLNQEHESSPSDPRPPEALALHYLSSDDPAAAERMAWRALRADPGREPARLYLARACAVVGRFQEAAIHYQRLLRKNPAHREAEMELRELVRRHARPVDGAPESLPGGGERGEQDDR